MLAWLWLRGSHSTGLSRCWDILVTVRNEAVWVI